MTEDRVWIDRVDDSPEAIAATLDLGLGKVGRLPTGDEAWAVKLNLTYPRYVPGVVNSPSFVEGLCRWAGARRVKLIFIEGDGGNAAYSAQETFDGNKVSDIARRFGMKCVSISEKPWEWRVSYVNGRAVRLPYAPFFRRREYDRFVTTPLFKNHIFTVVSLGMKNLWGCIPDPYRMYYHHVLDEGIVALSKELRPDFSIFDGLIGLRGRGPMDGEPIQLDTIMVANTVGAGETAAVSIMRQSLDKIRHLRIARQEGLLPAPGQVQWLSDPSAFQRSDFIVRRSWINWLSIWTARLPWLQHVIYHSRLSPAIYAVIDRFRSESVQIELAKVARSRKHSGASANG